MGTFTQKQIILLATCPVAWQRRVDDGEFEGHERTAYGRNDDRLAELKRVYDPGTVFRVNQNVEPADRDDSDHYLARRLRRLSQNPSFPVGTERV